MVHNLSMININLKNIKINKDLSQIECFQCFLSTENSNRFLFNLKLNDRAESNKRARGLENKTENRKVSDKHRKGRILAQNK